MLDRSRLYLIQILLQNGWTQVHKTDIKKSYSLLSSSQSAQVAIEEIFTAARDIVEALDGIVIKNLHPSLGLGDTCNAIEFDFFEYDTSNLSELREIQSKINKQVLFIGVGYDIIGDWLVDEAGAIYFRDKIHSRLHFVSTNIYQFLEQDIYTLTDIEGKNILT